MRNGQISHWMAADGAPASGGQFASRLAKFPLGDRNFARQVGTSPAKSSVDLPGGQIDLVVVGGGLSGLWTAWYALEADPSLRIVVVEAERVGYGASGRNGGWLSPLLPGNRAVYARRGGVEGVVALQRALRDTVDEVLDVCDREGIDADQHLGGNLVVATTPAGMQRLRDRRRSDLAHGYDEADVVELDAAHTRERVDVATACGGLFYPHVARIQPAKLVRGLSAQLRGRGVEIVEGVRVRAIHPGGVDTDRGPVAARNVVCATEGYSGPLLGHRTLIPVNSSMVVTEPLREATWERIGWAGQECLSDSAHTFVYAQRTADGRIAIGGRGRPYRLGGGTGSDGRTPARTVAELTDRLGAFFPGVDVSIAHAWSGVLGVSRDWCASVRWDDVTRVGSLGGYAGHGVTATNLAARTLVDRLLGRRTDLTSLPWNDHDSGRWEPEPVRWLGVHSMYRLFRFADAWEERRQSRRTALVARLGARIAGLHE